MLRFNRKGQSITDYAIVLGVVTVVLMSMSTYMKRGIQARIKDSADEFSDGVQYKGFDDGVVMKSEYVTAGVEKTTDVVRDGGEREMVKSSEKPQRREGISTIQSHEKYPEDGYPW